MQYRYDVRDNLNLVGRHVKPLVESFCQKRPDLINRARCNDDAHGSSTTGTHARTPLPGTLVRYVYGSSHGGGLLARCAYRHGERRMEVPCVTQELLITK